MKQLFPLGLLSLAIGFSIGMTTFPATAGPRPSPGEQIIQIKLRDLIELVPRDKEQGAALARKLAEIEARLAAIEQLLREVARQPAKAVPL